MKKIAIITPYHNNYGGGEIYIDNLNKYINQNQYAKSKIYTSDVKIFTSRTKEVPRINTYKNIIFNIFCVIKLLRDDKIDSVILNDIFISMFSVVFRMFGFNTFSLIHGELENIKIKRMILKKLIIIIRIYLIKTGSEKIFLVNKVNSKFFDENKCMYIGNFIDLEIDERNKNCKKEYEFVFSGRLVDVKNIEVMFEAFYEYIKNVKSKSKMLIIGDGPKREKIIDLINYYNIEDNIELVGFLPRNEVMKYYGRAKCLLLFSKSEGFPTVVLEALLCGIPCLVTNVGSNAEIVKDGINGYIIDTNNLEDVITKMKILEEGYYNYYENCIASVKKYSMTNVLEKVVSEII